MKFSFGRAIGRNSYYADTMICHCNILKEAQMLKVSIVERFAAYKLRLNEKSPAQYCLLQRR